MVLSLQSQSFFFKSANNDTVTGLDAVQVVSVADEWELGGLGNYVLPRCEDAMQSVVKRSTSISNDYLRSEFNLISSKIDPDG